MSGKKAFENTQKQSVVLECFIIETGNNFLTVQCCLLMIEAAYKEIL